MGGDHVLSEPDNKCPAAGTDLQALAARKLSTAESAELRQLLDLYDRSVLRRAKALSILAHRGYELPDQPDLP